MCNNPTPPASIHDAMMALFHNAQLHMHQPPVLSAESSRPEANPGATVLPVIWSQRVTHQPESDTRGCGHL